MTDTTSEQSAGEERHAEHGRAETHAANRQEEVSPKTNRALMNGIVQDGAEVLESEVEDSCGDGIAGDAAVVVAGAGVLALTKGSNKNPMVRDLRRATQNQMLREGQEMLDYFKTDGHGSAVPDGTTLNVPTDAAVSPSKKSVGELTNEANNFEVVGETACTTLDGGPDSLDTASAVGDGALSMVTDVTGSSGDFSLMAAVGGSSVTAASLVEPFGIVSTGLRVANLGVSLYNLHQIRKTREDIASLRATMEDMLSDQKNCLSSLMSGQAKLTRLAEEFAKRDWEELDKERQVLHKMHLDTLDDFAGNSPALQENNLKLNSLNTQAIRVETLASRLLDILLESMKKGDPDAIQARSSILSLIGIKAYALTCRDVARADFTGETSSDLMKKEHERLAKLIEDEVIDLSRYSSPFKLATELAPLLAQYSLLRHVVLSKLGLDDANEKSSARDDTERMQFGDVIQKDGGRFIWNDGLGKIRALQLNCQGPTSNACLPQIDCNAFENILWFCEWRGEEARKLANIGSFSVVVSDLLDYLGVPREYTLNVEDHNVTSAMDTLKGAVLLTTMSNAESRLNAAFGFSETHIFVRPCSKGLYYEECDSSQHYAKIEQGARIVDMLECGQIPMSKVFRSALQESCRMAANENELRDALVESVSHIRNIPADMQKQYDDVADAAKRKNWRMLRTALQCDLERLNSIHRQDSFVELQGAMMTLLTQSRKLTKFFKKYKKTFAMMELKVLRTTSNAELEQVLNELATDRYRYYYLTDEEISLIRNDFSQNKFHRLLWQDRLDCDELEDDAREPREEDYYCTIM